MTYRSMIRDFGNMSMAQAEALRARFSLSMSPDTLLFCGIHYKERLGRDPFVDELKMLDMLTAAQRKSGDSQALTEFLTNDAFVAKTYADMLKMRNKLHPEVYHPITLTDAANVANEYCTTKRKKKSNSNIHPHLENAPYRLHLLQLSDSAPCVGDTLVLLSPAKQDSQDEFYHKATALLQNRELMQFVKTVASIGHGGILPELLTQATGVHIYLPALAFDKEPIPATVLCNRFFKCKILRLAPQHWSKVSTLLKNSGVRATPFATVLEKEKFVFARDKQTAFEIETSFLHSLRSYETIRAKLPSESSRMTLSPSLHYVWNKAFPFLTSDNATQIGEVTQNGVGTCVSATATTAGSYYKTAIWSILAPTMALCACGIPYSKQELAIALDIPKDLSHDAVAGKCMSTVLGLFRAQTELKLAAKGGTLIDRNKDVSVPSIFVWAAAKNAKKLPNTFTTKGSSIYAVTPKFDFDGLPVFSDMRKKLNAIAKLANKGKILSFRVLSGETITDGICKMSSAYTCEKDDKAILTETKLPLCILIESNNRLPWRCVGKVVSETL